MKSLKEDIKIHFDSLRYPRLLISSGVENAASAFDIYSYKKFSEAAYKPIDNWRKPTKQEQKLLVSETDQMFQAHNIAIKRLDDDLIKLFSQFDFSNCKDKFEVADVFKGNLAVSQEINTKLNTLIKRHSPNKEFSFFRFVINRPAIQTLSYKPDGKEYIGLHIDTSSGLDLPDLDYSRNRISINIGKEARSVIFINLRLSEVVSLLNEKAGIAVSQINLDNIAQFFFTHFPEYPVVKFLQYPYEYYIAPTDNFFHDGSSIGMKTQDVTLIYLGYFNLTLDSI